LRKNLSILHSIIRHEFIHKEQFRLRGLSTSNKLPGFGMHARQWVVQGKKNIPVKTRRAAMSLTRKSIGTNSGISDYSYYRGQPEELMAWAQTTATLILNYYKHAESKYIDREFLGDMAAKEMGNTRRALGVGSPAYKKWLGFLYQYLSPRMPQEEIRQFFKEVIY